MRGLPTASSQHHETACTPTLSSWAPLDLRLRDAQAHAEALKRPLADARYPKDDLTIRKRAIVDIRPAQALNVCL
jgi:hypothetical protein